MRKCYSCQKEILANEMCWNFTMDTGGPNEGCSEFAHEEVEEHLCWDCCAKVLIKEDELLYKESNYV